MSLLDVGPAGGDGTDRGSGFLADLLTNFKRWNRKTLRNPFVVVVSLVQPVAFLFLFTEVFGAVGAAALEASEYGATEYVSFLLPAVVVQASLATAITSGVGLFDDMENGTFQKVTVTPMSTTAVFTGKTAAELLRLAVQVLVVLALAVAVGARIETGLPGVVGILVICLLFALWFTAVSNTLAIVTDNEAAVVAGANLLQAPLLFLSSGLLPVGTYPGWVRAIAAVNPVTYAVDAARALVFGRDVGIVSLGVFGGLYDTVVPAVAILLTLNVAFGALAVSLLSRSGDASVAR